MALLMINKTNFSCLPLNKFLNIFARKNLTDVSESLCISISGYNYSKNCS